MITLPRLLWGSLATVFVALAVGIPTGIVQTSWYTRMTPVTWWSYPVWAVSALLTGVLVATYIGPKLPTSTEQGAKTLGANVLATLAVGCPVCNKLVVMVLGFNGALTWFAPAQPVLAALSVALLTYALRARIRGMQSCPLPTAR